MPGLRALILGSGRIGHEVNALGVAGALGCAHEMRRVEPRYLFARLAPWGPADPRDRALFEGPAPDIVIASGRVTVPYVRAWKRRDGSGRAKRVDRAGRLQGAAPARQT